MNARVSGPSSGADAPQRDDVATVAAAGVLAATLAALFHETVGHGIGCVAAGGYVTLLTSIWFRCYRGTSLTDAGGAIAGVIFGALAFMVPLHRVRNTAIRLALLMFGAQLARFSVITEGVIDRLPWGSDNGLVSAQASAEARGTFATSP